MLYPILRPLWVIIVLAFAGPIVAQNNVPIEPLTQAALQGNADAQYALAERYSFGDSVLQNFGQAVHWYQLAAAQGHPEAQHRLGQSFYKGRGIDVSQEDAVHWLSLAAQNGVPQFHFDLGLALEKGADGSTDAKAAAAQYKLAAEGGHLQAKVALGALYQEGQGVTQDYVEAHRLYQDAASAGHAQAQNNLGLLYVRGHGVEQDYTQAAELFQQAANRGLQQAMRNLGVMFENGFGVALNEETAERLYREAANQRTVMSFVYDSRLQPLQVTTAKLVQLQTNAASGDPVAQFQLGWVLAQDEKSQREAVSWFKKAARKGHSISMANLGFAFVEGRGTIQNYMLGRVWLTLAGSMGVSEASIALEDLDRRMTDTQIVEAQKRAELEWSKLRGEHE